MKHILFTFIMLTFVTGVFAQDGEFHLDQEYKINANGIIDLSSSDAKVFITGSKRSTAHVKIDRKITTKGWSWGDKDFKVEVDEYNGNLRIRERQSGAQVSVVGYYNESYRIEIEAPEGVSLTVKGDDGDYYIKNVNGSVSLVLDDADAELSDCKGNEFSFRLDDGDIRMDQGKGRLEIDADDGDVEIYKAAFTYIDADVDDGDLVIETALDNQGQYRFNTQDGLISLNILNGGGEFDIRHDDGRVLTQGNFKISKESEDRTVATLASGSAKVSVRADDARVKLFAH